MPIRRVLILGCKGTLGGQLMKLYPEATGWDREDIDVLDFPALRARVASLPSAPDAVINCVAFNDVDGAEDRPHQAFALNAEFPGSWRNSPASWAFRWYTTAPTTSSMEPAANMWRPTSPRPFPPMDGPNWGGEERIAEAAAHCYIVRTAVIFGPKGESDLSKKSFVDLMRDLSAKRDTIQAVSDEINSVTYAPDLAAGTRDLLERLPEPGIYHLTNRGSASWFDLAGEIFRIAGKTVNLLPVPSTRFPRKALRPAKAILHNTRLPELRPWQDALAEFLSAARMAFARAPESVLSPGRAN
jgi:dTDP-4-dehydrorhamnose reductase